jgi:hypothetical protein
LRQAYDYWQDQPGLFTPINHTQQQIKVAMHTMTCCKLVEGATRIGINTLQQTSKINNAAGCTSTMQLQGPGNCKSKVCLIAPPKPVGLACEKQQQLQVGHAH